MTLLSKTELSNLLESGSKPCISIYMSAEKTGTETRKNPIRFKNLVGEAEAKLVDAGLTDSEADAFLQEAKTLIDNYDFWQHQAEGLAFFLSDDQLRYYRLPHDFAELVVVGDRFHLKPLLPLITRDAKFYLLALSQNQIRFFQGTRHTIQELELPEDVPASLAEALRYDEPEKQLQSHSVRSDRNPVFHGQGVGTTDNKRENARKYICSSYFSLPCLSDSGVKLLPLEACELSNSKAVLRRAIAILVNPTIFVTATKAHGFVAHSSRGTGVTSYEGQLLWQCNYSVRT